MDTSKLLLRPTEAADAISVSRSKVYKLISSGTIPSIRIGGSVRIPVDALRNWIARELETRAVADDLVATSRAGSWIGSRDSIPFVCNHCSLGLSV